MAEAKSGNSTVLVVDDEPNLVKLYSMFLADKYEVRTAYGGKEAIEKTDNSIDVVLLDRRMPKVAGDEVAEYIQERELDFAVAMVTAVEPSSEIFDLPIDDYVKKPVGEEDLRSLVEVLLKRRKFDEKSRRFFQLAAKKAAFEGSDSYDQEEMGDAEKYQEIVSEMKVLESEINETLDSLSVDHLVATYRDV